MSLYQSTESGGSPFPDAIEAEAERLTSSRLAAEDVLIATHAPDLPAAIAKATWPFCRRRQISKPSNAVVAFGDGADGRPHARGIPWRVRLTAGSPSNGPWGLGSFLDFVGVREPKAQDV